MEFMTIKEIRDLVERMDAASFDVLRHAVQEREQDMINEKRKAMGLSEKTHMPFEEWMKLRDKQGLDY